MNILFVMNEFFAKNNGLSLSAQRFAGELSKLGHKVRVLAVSTSGAPDYPLDEAVIPVFDSLIKKQGMTFAQTDEAMIEKAVAWADVVHLYDPFVVSSHAARAARSMGKACTAGFHVYPENITSSQRLAWNEPLNDMIVDGFRDYTFRYCSDIHCPSGIVEERLKKHRYRARLHVISNGVPPEFAVGRREKPPEYDGKLVILSTGRFSVEKRQDVIIDAVSRSPFSSNIQLIFAGRGPLREQYIRRARELENPPVFRFMNKDELIETIAYSDLYVHAADAEIEGMSALEAISSGLVPIISNSAKSATKQFALDGRSVFNAGNAESLSKKLSYWIDNPSERERMRSRYRASTKQYSLQNSARALESMFFTAFEEAYGREEKAL